MECELCRPLGIATWATKGAVRNLRVRALKPEEVRAVQKNENKRAADDR
jgi:hypothetical protein